MATNKDYPFWPPTFPRVADRIVNLQVGNIIADLKVNQIPHGNENHIPVLQRTYPRQAQALQPLGTNETQGHYGSNLYDLFMAPYNVKAAG